jgi:hypothetical protein
MNAQVTTNTPAIHALNRIIVVVLSSLDPARDDPEPVEGSESVRVFGMERILALRRRRRTPVFDGLSRRQAELDRGCGERGWSSPQAASSKADPVEAKPTAE